MQIKKNGILLPVLDRHGGILRMKYFNLGSYTKPITTSSPTAQIWFDRGLVWTYAFNHEEAIVCFQKAIETDPECALAHWGIAYAIGPN